MLFFFCTRVSKSHDGRLVPIRGGVTINECHETFLGNVWHFCVFIKVIDTIRYLERS